MAFFSIFPVRQANRASAAKALKRIRPRPRPLAQIAPKLPQRRAVRTARYAHKAPPPARAHWKCPGFTPDRPAHAWPDRPGPCAASRDRSGEPAFAQRVKARDLALGQPDRSASSSPGLSTFLVIRLLEPGRLRAGRDDRGHADLPRPVQRLGLRQLAGPRRQDRRAPRSARRSRMLILMNGGARARAVLRRRSPPPISTSRWWPICCACRRSSIWPTRSSRSATRC